MLYVILIPALIILLHAYHQVRQAKKHDGVLYRFCQIRREIMDVLREENDTLSAEEYRMARNMLEFVNLTVALYRDHRATIFDWRRFVKFAREYKASAEEIRALPRTDHETLNATVRKVLAASFAGFATYTPLFATGIALRLTVSVAELLAHVARGAVVERARRARDFALFVREQLEQFGAQAA